MLDLEEKNILFFVVVVCFSLKFIGVKMVKVT